MNTNDQNWYQQSFDRMLDPALWTGHSDEIDPANKENIEKSLTDRLAGIANDYFQHEGLSPVKQGAKPSPSLIDRFFSVGIKNQWLTNDKIDMLRDLANQAGLVSRTGRVKTARGRDHGGITNVIINTIQKMKKAEVERDASPVRKKPKVKAAASELMQEARKKTLIQLYDEGVNDLIFQRIKEGADPNVPDDRGETVLHRSVNDGDLALTQFLVMHGAAIDVKENEGFTPLHLAAASKDSRFLETLLTEEGDIDRKDENGRTPLYVTVHRDIVENAELLLKQGAAIDFIDAQGFSPLQIAISNESDEMTALLLSYGADPNFSDDTGWSPVFEAVAYGNWEALKMVIDAGAQLFTFNKDKLDPLTYLKMRRPKNYLQIKNTLQENEQLKQFSKELLKRIFLTHLSEVSLKSSMVSNRFNVLTKADAYCGIESEYSYQKIESNMEKFAKRYPQFLSERESRLVRATITSNETPPQIMEDLMERWQAEKPILLDGGFKQHYIGFVLWKDKLLICNRGPGRLQEDGSKTSTIAAYTFDKDKLGADLLLQIKATARQGGQRAYEHFLTHELYPQLNCKKTALDRLIEDWSLPEQIIGNCAWANAIESIYVLLILNKLNELDLTIESHGEDEIETILSMEHQTVVNLELFMLLNRLEKYIRWASDPTNTFIPDMARIDRIFNRQLSTRVIIPDLIEQWENAKEEWEKVKLAREANPMALSYHFGSHLRHGV